MDWRGRRLGVVVGAVTLAVLAGCTPSAMPTQTPPTATTPSSGPSQVMTPTLTPTPTWDADQSAAIDVVRGYYSVTTKIGADPSKYTDAEMTNLIEQYAGGEMIDANVGYYSGLRERHYHETGQARLLSTDATQVVDNHNDRGLEVHVTMCWDQTQVSVLDGSGVTVTEEEFKIPPYNLRQFSVRMPAESDTWLVFGAQTVEGACG